MNNIAHLPEQRRAAILSILQRGEAVSAAELATRFAVSEDAIRRDLRKLAAEGLCEKVYGGALPISAPAQPFSVRADENLERKAALAAAAVSLLQPRQCLFLDVGSTNALLAKTLPENLDLTVVTNSVPVLNALFGKAGIRLFAIGGPVNMHVGGTTGAKAVEDLARFRFDLTFLGACSLSRAAGICCFDGDDADMKRAAVANSNAVAALVMIDKLETGQPHRIVDFEDLDYLVLEEGTPPELIEDYRSSDIRILVAGNRAGAEAFK